MVRAVVVVVVVVLPFVVVVDDDVGAGSSSSPLSSWGPGTGMGKGHPPCNQTDVH